MDWSRFATVFAAGAASMTLIAGAAHAQIGQSDAPIEITSEKSEYLQTWQAKEQAGKGRTTVLRHKLYSHTLAQHNL